MGGEQSGILEVSPSWGSSSEGAVGGGGQLPQPQGDPPNGRMHVEAGTAERGEQRYWQEI